MSKQDVLERVREVVEAALEDGEDLKLSCAEDVLEILDAYAEEIHLDSGDDEV